MPEKKTKFIVIAGSIMSGLGKGIVASSIAKLLQARGLKVMPIKSIDTVAIGNDCPGPVTRAVAEKVSDVFGGKLKKFEYWLTYIY